MNNSLFSTLIVIVCVLVGGAVAIFGFMRPEANSDPVLEAGLQSEIGRLKQDLADQGKTMDEIKGLLADLRSRPAAQTRAGLSADDVRAIVAEMGGARAEVASGQVETAKAAAAQEFVLERELSRFATMTDDWEGRQAIWKEIAKNGKWKEALAWFEARARSESNNPDAQTDLGEAYIAKLTGGNIPFNEMGVLANKAEKSFNAALEIDETHWRSRFNKAMTLANSPDFLGRRPEAINQFEILASQQEKQPAQSHFAATQLFLGNMYAQTGKTEEAQAAWKKGLEYDPTNTELLNKIAGNAGR